MLNAVIIGSPNVNPGYVLVNNKNYPQIAGDYVKTFALLKTLLRHAGQVMSREQLLSNLRGYSFDPTSNVVDDKVASRRRRSWMALTSPRVTQDTSAPACFRQASVASPPGPPTAAA